MLVWIVAAALSVTVPMAGANPLAQLDFGLAHPEAIWLTLRNTLALSSKELVPETIDKPGWLDTTLDPRFYDVALVLLILGVASTLAGRSRRPYLPVAIILATAICLVAARYLTWTTPGSTSSCRAPSVSGRCRAVPG